MPLKDLHYVLGDPSVLEAAAGTARSAAIVEGGLVVGLACFELLYGPHAEMALAVRDRSQVHLVADLIGQLTPLVRRHHAHTLELLVGSGQLELELAAAVPGGEIREGRLELRLSDLPA